MDFESQALLLPQWVQIWMNIIVVAPIVSVIVLLFHRSTRKDAAVTFVLTALAFASVLWLHSQMGMVRLIGLGHVIFWTPLVIYLLRRIRTNPPPLIFKSTMMILFVLLTIALAFDYYDVLRWLMGERGSVV